MTVLAALGVSFVVALVVLIGDPAPLAQGRSSDNITNRVVREAAEQTADDMCRTSGYCDPNKRRQYITATECAIRQALKVSSTVREALSKVVASPTRYMHCFDMYVSN